MDFEIKKTITETIKVLPCIKCGCDDIDIDDCGYSSFNVAWGKCKKCKHEILINPCAWDMKKTDIINAWNNANDPQLLKEKYELEISELQIKIDNLPIDNEDINKL